MIRTTISLREDFYKKLRMLAAASGVTMSEIVNNTLDVRGIAANKVDMEEKVKKSWDLFEKLAKSGKPVNMAQALAESRRERDEKLGN